MSVTIHRFVGGFAVMALADIGLSPDMTRAAKRELTGDLRSLVVESIALPTPD